jgi:Plasmid pRiA4b ORF-3-like protein
MRGDRVATAGPDLRRRPVAQFADLAAAIVDTSALWDRTAHLHMFDLGESGGLLIDQYWDDPPEDSRADTAVKLSTLTAGRQSAWIFDLGDNWSHRCTVGAEQIDPDDTPGITPDWPMPYWR